ncbi:MAG: amino acid permease [Chloroflexi bacterium]|nr:amino acid permease [Chloroflexota bacterium]
MAQQLKRELGVFGATMMGLGSIIGTGIFVSVGIGAGVTGPAVILAIAFAAFVATCNGLNSAQLAANHPVSGGTYEYGYHYLTPQFGFIAGWTFLLAKSASAATAALGFAGYLLDALGSDDTTLLVPLALAAVIVLTLIVVGGIRRSNTANTIIVSITLAALALFVIAGIPSIDGANFSPFLNAAEDGSGGINLLLQATALMFVAYTGYGRIATMGEEVREPRRTIPRAIITTLVTTMILYVAVAFVGVGTIGAEALSGAANEIAAPLEVAASSFGIPAVPELIAIGAITAMLGVLLNLILGLSRVLLAMGRRRDMPTPVARLNSTGTTPYVAVIVMGAVIGGLVLIGDVRTTWSFSAFTVLIYYAITNLAALRLKPEERLFPPIIAWIGLAACLFLAFWVELSVLLVGLGLLVVGLGWHFAAQAIANRANRAAVNDG